MIHFKKILIYSFILLSFTACKKRNEEFKNQEVTPSMAFNQFINEYKQNINIAWIYEKSFQNQWTAYFQLAQPQETISRMVVNQDWDKNIHQKEINIPLVANDFNILEFNAPWTMNIYNSATELITENIEVAEKLMVTIDLNGAEGINPNNGFRIQLSSSIPQSANSLSGDMKLIFYAKNEALGIHNYTNIAITQNTTFVDISPQMLASYQQFDELEIYLFQREIFDFEWFEERVGMQMITSQAFKYPFIIF